jgi:hypothetical protein
MATAETQFPFEPTGLTHLLIADSVAPAPIQVSTPKGTTGLNEYRLVNNGINIVFLGVGKTATDATNRATSIAAGTPSQTIVLVPGAVEILRLSNDSFFTGLSSSATDVYITPGQGL